MIIAEDAYHKTIRNAKKTKEKRVAYTINICNEKIYDAISKGRFSITFFDEVDEDFPDIISHFTSLGYKAEIRKRETESFFPKFQQKYLYISWDIFKNEKTLYHPIFPFNFWLFSTKM